MSFSKFGQIEELTEGELKEELLALKKQLFDLRVQQSTRQKIKPHLFTHIKHRISQLRFRMHNKPTDKV